MKKLFFLLSLFVLASLSVEAQTYTTNWKFPVWNTSPADSMFWGSTTDTTLVTNPLGQRRNRINLLSTRLEAFFTQFFDRPTKHLRGINTIDFLNGQTINGDASSTLAIPNAKLLVGGLTSDLVGPNLIAVGQNVGVVSGSTNASVLLLGVNTSSGYANVASTRTGTGTFQPLDFFTSDTRVMRIQPSRQIAVNDISASAVFDVKGLPSATTDNIYSAKDTSGNQRWLLDNAINMRWFNTVGGEVGKLAPTGTSWLSGTLRVGSPSTDYTGGRIISIGSGEGFATATASSNAVVGFLNAYPTYVALSSTRTGTGGYQPLDFFTSDTRRMRITIDGKLLVGGHTTPFGTYWNEFQSNMHVAGVIRSGLGGSFNGGLELANRTNSNIVTITVQDAVSANQTIKLPLQVSTVNPTNPNRTIKITIDGVDYYIHAKTTND
jgi:hypothetical protein